MNKSGRVFLAGLILVCTSFGIGYLFWQQEIKYVLPTPVPPNYQPVNLQTPVLLDNSGIKIMKGPYFLHFFNPECPCSKFNVKHFNYLVKTYQKEIFFAVVIPEFADKQAARDLLAPGIPILVDEQDRIAKTCGVYSSPQAVILDSESKLYFRGNYNKARYCTLKESNYAEMALQDLLAGKPSKNYGLLASRAYGCEFTEEKIFNLIEL